MEKADDPHLPYFRVTFSSLRTIFVRLDHYPSFPFVHFSFVVVEIILDCGRDILRSVKPSHNQRRRKAIELLLSHQ